ncbi:phosphoribosylpyrophosphate synthetase [Pedobacter sp. HMF7647]|uniref:Phosphoribosylpyrophosphate synthetase n=1 Tax=Hufsiella arboris TaxID=2695275 RepID=A0A7K1YB11_9SPHI|nr:phosphoribosylpyrophosphate synthetase [Hufsiella arboris]MXV51777.1 phosphoribosylpyrophosphate synthetase [Hufsiella arboris]
MNTGITYDTLSQAMSDLQSRGYTDDFDFKDSCLYCNSISQTLNPSDLKITGVYRFEGMTNPDDSAVLYAIESNSGQKGLLVDAYGVYADEHKTAFLSEIPVVED